MATTFGEESIGSCRSLNSSTLLTNTSSTLNATYVKVSCTPGHQLSALHTTPGQNVFQCLNSFWAPSIPHCVEVQDSGVPVGIVVGCTIGCIVCLLVVLVAVYLLYRNRGEGEAEKQNDLLHKAKMMHLDFFMTSFQQDNVGMPAVTAESVDFDLRGVADDNMSSYGNMEISGKPYRSSGSVFMESEEETGSDEPISSARNNANRC